MSRESNAAINTVLQLYFLDKFTEAEIKGFAKIAADVHEGRITMDQGRAKLRDDGLDEFLGPDRD